MGKVMWNVSGEGMNYLYALFEVLKEGTFAEAGESQFVLKLGERTVVFDGDFELNGLGGISGGVITGFQVYHGGKVLDASGYTINIDDFTLALEQTQGDAGSLLMRGLLLDEPIVMKGSGQPNDLFSGRGNDKLVGKGGDDILFSFEGRDVIIGGNGADWCGGGRGKDAIKGGKGADIIDGEEHRDVLTGGADNDAFVFQYDLGPKNIDRITDFKHGQDTIHLHNSVFGGAAGDPLAADAFHVGAKAKDSEDRIIYDRSKGALYYDVDGKGGADQIQFAKLDGSPRLDAGDFLFD